MSRRLIEYTATRDSAVKESVNDAATEGEFPVGTIVSVSYDDAISKSDVIAVLKQMREKIVDNTTS